MRKRNNNPKLIVAYIVCFIMLVLGLIGQFDSEPVTSKPSYDDTKIEQPSNNDIAPETPDITPEAPQQQPAPDVTTSNGYQPTTWDPASSPDMYKVHGAAMILSNDLAPGEIRYDYDRTSKTQSVSALLTYENIEHGKRERESISHIEPIGWPENNGRAHVTFPTGETYNGWFWNRSHLLGHALGGDDEEYNLVTGTRAQNVGANDMHGGMQYTETLVRDYLESNPNGNVYYMVEAPYATDENIPRSVFIDVRSDDRSIDMHLEVYNVMPDYDIDYMTGNFSAK